MEDIGKIIYQFYEQTKPVFIVFWAWILSILTPVDTVLCIYSYDKRREIIAFVSFLFITKFKT